MSEALAALKAKAIHDVTLEDGTRMGLKLPNVRSCLIAGGVPLSVVTKMEAAASAKNGDAPEVTLEDLAYDTAFQAEMVCQMVKTIEDEPVTITHGDVGDLDEDVRLELWAYASRNKPLPKAT